VFGIGRGNGVHDIIAVGNALVDVAQMSARIMQQFFGYLGVLFFLFALISWLLALVVAAWQALSSPWW
jgi:preprotein translocase subunit SecG